MDVFEEDRPPSGEWLRRQTASLDAMLEVKVVASGDAGYSLWFILEKGKVRHQVTETGVDPRVVGPEGGAGDLGAQATGDPWSEGLGASGLVDFDASGRVRGIEALRANEVADQAALRQVASLFQWVKNGDEGASHWQTNEMDSLGSFEARYTPAASFASGATAKELAYTGLVEGWFPPGTRLVWARGEFLVDGVAPIVKGKGERRATLQLPREGKQFSILERYMPSLL